MSTPLARQLLSPERIDPLVSDLVALIHSHVSTRGGLRGMTLRTGLGLLKSTRPDLLERAVRRLLPEFAVALEPLHQQSQAQGEPHFSRFLQGHAGAAIEALLRVADARAAQAGSAGVRSTYQRLRGIAEDELRQVLPRLGELIEARLRAP